MTINSALNLVFPIRVRVDEKPDPKDSTKVVREVIPLIRAYHVPISAEVFQANYRIIAAAKWEIFSEGTAYAATNGPRIATLALRNAAQADAERGGTESQAPALLNELRRLTTVLAPAKDGKSGYEFMPLDLAVQHGIVDAEEADEAQSALVFFTVAYAMATRIQREAIGKAMASVLGGSTTSLPPTEWANSLPASTPGAPSPAIPSSPRP